MNQFTMALQFTNNQKKNEPEWVFGLQVRCRELDIFKIRNFLRNCLEFFWIFFGIFGGNFLGGFFWKDLFESFWEDFFGRIFWEDFFGRNSLFILLKPANLFESERD